MPARRWSGLTGMRRSGERACIRDVDGPSGCLAQSHSTGKAGDCTGVLFEEFWSPGTLSLELAGWEGHAVSV